MPSELPPRHWGHHCIASNCFKSGDPQSSCRCPPRCVFAAVVEHGGFSRSFTVIERMMASVVELALGHRAPEALFYQRRDIPRISDSEPAMTALGVRKVVCVILFDRSFFSSSAALFVKDFCAFSMS